MNLSLLLYDNLYNKKNLLLITRIANVIIFKKSKNNLAIYKI